MFQLWLSPSIVSRERGGFGTPWTLPWVRPWCQFYISTQVCEWYNEVSKRKRHVWQGKKWRYEIFSYSIRVIMIWLWARHSLNSYPEQQHLDSQNGQPAGQPGQTNLEHTEVPDGQFKAYFDTQYQVDPAHVAVNRKQLRVRLLAMKTSCSRQNRGYSNHHPILAPKRGRTELIRYKRYYYRTLIVW